MTTFLVEMLRVLPKWMVLPDPIAMLLTWLEDQGRIERAEDGAYIAALNDGSRGSDVLIFARPAELAAWFGTSDSAVLDRVFPFARTGADGSQAAFWIDEGGRQAIVHLGSGSGSMLACVLADDATDFVRLLAIGYQELAWPDAFDRRPGTGDDAGIPDPVFRAWVEAAFGAPIPATAAEIVKDPALMTDPEPTDRFARWLPVVLPEH